VRAFFSQPSINIKLHHFRYAKSESDGFMVIAGRAPLSRAAEQLQAVESLRVRPVEYAAEALSLLHIAFRQPDSTISGFSLE
jgi:hypothetical protein